MCSCGNNATTYTITAVYDNETIEDDFDGDEEFELFESSDDQADDEEGDDFCEWDECDVFPDDDSLPDDRIEDCSLDDLDCAICEEDSRFTYKD